MNQALQDVIEHRRPTNVFEPNHTISKLTSHQRAEAIKMVTTGAKSAAEVARLFRVHRSSISRLLTQVRSGN
jgi:transposase-like protein